MYPPPPYSWGWVLPQAGVGVGSNLYFPCVIHTIWNPHLVPTLGKQFIKIPLQHLPSPYATHSFLPPTLENNTYISPFTFFYTPLPFPTLASPPSFTILFQYDYPFDRLSLFYNDNNKGQTKVTDDAYAKSQHMGNIGISPIGQIWNCEIWSDFKLWDLMKHRWVGG